MGQKYSDKFVFNFIKKLLFERFIVWSGMSLLREYCQVKDPPT